MADLIDRQTAIETAIEAADKWDGGYSSEREWIIRKFFDKVPAVQQDHVAESGKKAEGDCISRKTALDALAKQMPRSYTPDGSHPADEEIYKAQEIYVDCIESIEILPAVQPEIIRCKDCNWWTKQKDSVQGRCALMQMYPAGGWHCGNARRRGGDSD